MTILLVHFAGDQTGRLKIWLQLGGYGKEGRKGKGDFKLYIVLISVAKKKRVSKFQHKKRYKYETR